MILVINNKLWHTLKTKKMYVLNILLHYSKLANLQMCISKMSGRHTVYVKYDSVKTEHLTHIVGSIHLNAKHCIMIH